MLRSAGGKHWPGPPWPGLLKVHAESPAPVLQALLVPPHCAQGGVRAKSNRISTWLASAVAIRPSVVVQSKTPGAVLICAHAVSLSQKRCAPKEMFGHGELT